MSVNTFHRLWSFDPASDSVRISTPNQDANHVDDGMYHEDLGVDSPEGIHGYATPVGDDWRIFDDGLNDVDPYIARRIRDVLGHKQIEPLPYIRYHGDPGESFYSEL